MMRQSSFLGLREAELNVMMTEVCGATNCIMTEVGRATSSMMKVCGATKSNSRNYKRYSTGPNKV